MLFSPKKVYAYAHYTYYPYTILSLHAKFVKISTAKNKKTPLKGVNM